MTRTTTILAILFFIVCMSLAYVSSNRATLQGVAGSVISQGLEMAPQLGDSDMPPSDGGGSAQDSDLPPAE
jgi:hypothetical protein